MFVFGIQKRIGDVVHQDKDATLGVVHKLIEGLEVDYLEGEVMGKKKR